MQYILQEFSIDAHVLGTVNGVVGRGVVVGLQGSQELFDPGLGICNFISKEQCPVFQDSDIKGQLGYVYPDVKIWHNGEMEQQC
jgi:hypothetical protein